MRTCIPIFYVEFFIFYFLVYTYVFSPRGAYVEYVFFFNILLEVCTQYAKGALGYETASIPAPLKVWVYPRNNKLHKRPESWYVQYVHYVGMYVVAQLRLRGKSPSIVCTPHNTDA